MKKLFAVLVLLTAFVHLYAQPWAYTTVGSISGYLDMSNSATYKTGTIEGVQCRYVLLGTIPANAQVTDVDIYVATGFGANAPKDSVTIGTLTDGDYLTQFVSAQNEGIASPTWNASTDGYAQAALQGKGFDLYLIYWRDTTFPSTGKVIATVTYGVFKRTAK